MSDDLEPWPSLTPNVGYQHPDLGFPDEDVELKREDPVSRDNIRLAIYKNKNEDNIIRLFNTTPLIIETILINTQQIQIFSWQQLVQIETGLGHELKDGSFLIHARHFKRDILGNFTITIKCSRDGTIYESKEKVFSFNILESDGENSSYVIYQKK